MIIPEELATRIVTTAMSVVHRNVNIMNRDGMIIATGHPHRYKTFHKGAKDAVEKAMTIEIYPAEVALYPGALQGVNLPIVLEDQIVGVVGVFGDPEEVRDTGRLVKMITELILERELLHQESRSKERLREQFIDLSLWQTGPDVPAKIKRIAKNLGIDMTLPRTVVILGVSKWIEHSFSEYGESEFVLERATEIIVKQLTDTGLLSEQDITVMINETLFIIKAFSVATDARQSVQEWGERLMNSVQQYTKEWTACGVGAVVSSVAGYPASYRHAEYCLKQCSAAQPFRNIYERDLLVNFAMNEAMTSSVCLAAKQVAGSFCRDSSLKSETKNTIQALLANDLDLNRTADFLHIHRNTLIYRIRRLKDETGLDPVHSLNDAIVCKMLLVATGNCISETDKERLII